jgi:hypothetical protein
MRKINKKISQNQTHLICLYVHHHYGKIKWTYGIEYLIYCYFILSHELIWDLDLVLRVRSRSPTTWAIAHVILSANTKGEISNCVIARAQKKIGRNVLFVQCNIETSCMFSLIWGGLYREAACSRNTTCSWGMWQQFPYLHPNTPSVFFIAFVLI